MKFFHGYIIMPDGRIYNKYWKLLKHQKSKRRGGGYCMTVRLSYAGKKWKWRVHRLVAACYLGPIHGYEINHKDRNTENNDVSNLERLTASENQKHWREDEERR